MVYQKSIQQADSKEVLCNVLLKEKTIFDGGDVKQYRGCGATGHTGMCIRQNQRKSGIDGWML
ncbi:MAG: hypothetical protein BMS9Abin36_0539 [Gammaproteobacteria bacterium]|nr:MAG: hypothetical protein BMS9Abin36_0539 [Gammaproteobacteria bacterium]